mmetsp:Transcript_326/g.371  ORF Transcript_326/g.371 Transcript_326/m.371 type:complete len:83 (-) Transcript_326:340-588(-)|eukprot:CAMPEP_0197447874 /NCGR_PEP_ID=MMETSP1175-20131217/15184_1 /TAXON_ID=1003142 /ORGANISM="Triceratium dubium, Strain CCMP147" /LENGTH=82 /DNA_ID=CAMNT_0042979419 /DNA_START=56 /DNA_END=304 /DNA_ORIENTATION=+
MKIALALLALAAGASAFAPAAPFTRGVVAPSVVPSASTALFSDKEEEEEGLDLNLEEMFDMFDAADKGEDFDESVKKIKGDD